MIYSTLGVGLTPGSFRSARFALPSLPVVRNEDEEDEEFEEKEEDEEAGVDEGLAEEHFDEDDFDDDFDDDFEEDTEEYEAAEGDESDTDKLGDDEPIIEEFDEE